MDTREQSLATQTVTQRLRLNTFYDIYPEQKDGGMGITAIPVRKNLPVLGAEVTGSPHSEDIDANLWTTWGNPRFNLSGEYGVYTTGEGTPFGTRAAGQLRVPLGSASLRAAVEKTTEKGAPTDLRFVPPRGTTSKTLALKYPLFDNTGGFTVGLEQKDLKTGVIPHWYKKYFSNPTLQESHNRQYINLGIPFPTSRGSLDLRGSRGTGEILFPQEFGQSSRGRKSILPHYRGGIKLNIPLSPGFDATVQGSGSWEKDKPPAYKIGATVNTSLSDLLELFKTKKRR
jgi:hypothetical protein